MGNDTILVGSDVVATADDSIELTRDSMTFGKSKVALAAARIYTADLPPIQALGTGIHVSYMRCPRGHVWLVARNVGHSDDVTCHGDCGELLTEY